MTAERLWIVAVIASEGSARGPLVAELKNKMG
jgi:hypothetical protein